MSLRLRVNAYLLSLHIILFALILVLYRTAPLVLLTLEVLLLISLVGGAHLIARALEPLGYVHTMRDLLQEQQYAARLKSSGGAELGSLVALFNGMLDTLYQERIKAGEQQGLLDRLLEATPSAVLVFDFDGRISLFNASADSLLGLANAKGHRLADQTGEDAPADGVERHVHASRRFLCAQLDALPLGEARMLAAPDGRRFRAQRSHFFDRSFARHFLFVEELTAELESSEKATYEKLIRVLAHEVNNTVAATGSVLESLLFYRPQLADGDDVDFSTAIVAVKRRNASLGEFIERFTRVVKMPAPELRPTALAPMLDDIVYLYREQCKSANIEITWTRCDPIAPLALDRALMEQALINVIKNAIEAVTSAKQARSATGYIHLALARTDSCVTLSVIDSGNGIDQASAQHLFTPFFTTKKGGQGIGLVFVREVLNRHSVAGRLRPNGNGETQFDIVFPVHT